MCQTLLFRESESVFSVATDFGSWTIQIEKEAGSEFIKLNSTQLSMKFFLLINVKMPTIVGILTFLSGKNSLLGLSKRKNADFLYFYIYEHLKFRAQLS